MMNGSPTINHSSNATTNSSTGTTVSNSSNVALQRKVHKVLETRTDNPELLQALQHLSSFYGKNSLVARRNLRGQIETRGIHINNEFLDVFLNVQKNLDEVQDNIKQMKRCCDEMSERLQYTKDISGKLIQQAEELNKQRKLHEKYTEIIDTFLGRFQLTNDEVNALKGPEINTDFFKALQRVHQIHTDCKVLLRTQHQRAGLEIMDTMSVYLESAYNRLYRWVRNECRNLNSAVPEITVLMRQALNALKERPLLLSYCLDEVAGTRSKAVTRAFLSALTQGGPNGVPRPIDMQAHDPVRYVGDMLAWLHQSLASESEFINSLVIEATQKENSSPTRIASKSKELGSSILIDEGGSPIDILKVLDTIFESVCRPFKLRLDQVLQSKPGIVVVYKLSNLLDFYSRTTKKIMGEKSALPTTLKDCKQDSLKLFFDLLKEYADKLQRAPPSPPPNLTPPHEIYESINRLRDIVIIFDSSLVPVNEREAEFRPVLNAFMDPLIQICNLSASGLTLSDMAVYLINCLTVMQNELSSYDFAITRMEMLSAHIKAHMDTLIEEQASMILNSCGLSSKIGLIQGSTSGEALSTLPLMDTKSITDTIRSFEASVLEAGSLLMPHCDRLLSTIFRTQARNGVATLVYQSYVYFYNAIVDAKNKYEDPHNLFLYKPEQVKTMLSLDS